MEIAARIQKKLQIRNCLREIKVMFFREVISIYYS
jgi:hypothetical protein